VASSLSKFMRGAATTGSKLFSQKYLDELQAKRDSRLQSYKSTEAGVERASRSRESEKDRVAKSKEAQKDRTWKTEEKDKDRKLSAAETALNARWKLPGYKLDLDKLQENKEFRVLWGKFQEASNSGNQDEMDKISLEMKAHRGSPETASDRNGRTGMTQSQIVNHARSLTDGAMKGKFSYGSEEYEAEYNKNLEAVQRLYGDGSGPSPSPKTPAPPSPAKVAEAIREYKALKSKTEKDKHFYSLSPEMQKAILAQASNKGP